jgi:hypothetical protein
MHASLSINDHWPRLDVRINGVLSIPMALIFKASHGLPKILGGACETVTYCASLVVRLLLDNRSIAVA